MKPLVLTMFACLSLSGFALSVEPTPSRQWEAVTGHKTEATALSCDRTSVELKLASGKTISLPLEKLVEADRVYLAEHFGFEIPKEGEPVPSDDKPLEADAAPHPIGEIVGPLRASEISTYYIYLPKSLKRGRMAPLLHFNDASPVNQAKMKMLIPACERFGWVLVGSVESRNGYAESERCAVDNVEEVKKLGIVDPERLYFTGNSGGGARSWLNCLKLKGAGTIPFNGYIPNSREYSYGSGHHYVVGGAGDFNRYLSGYAADRYKGDAVYRPYPGKHSRPSASAQWIYEDALGWLTMRYLMSKESDSSFRNERLDFEAAMIGYIHELVEAGNPHLAYHLTRNLKEDYKISGPNGDIVTQLNSSLGGVREHVLFSEGLAAIHDFGVDTFSEKGTGGSHMGEAFPEHNRKIDKLLETYAGVPFVDETLKGMKEATK